jgi:hypothetical protein
MKRDYPFLHDIIESTGLLEVNGSNLLSIILNFCIAIWLGELESSKLNIIVLFGRLRALWLWKQIMAASVVLLYLA